jgi:DNA-binding protein HU-beta
MGAVSIVFGCPLPETRRVMMNKKALISAVAEQTGLSKKDVESAFGAIFQKIKNVLAEGHKISIKGFGTFSIKERKAKTGRHPKTGQTLQIPAREVPVFKAGSQLKDVIAQTKEKTAAVATPEPKTKKTKPKAEDKKREKSPTEKSSQKKGLKIVTLM